MTDGQINILAVDDVAANLYSLEVILKDNAYENENFKNLNIMKALSGEECLRIAMNQDVDLIILDIQMPNMDGFEVAKFLKSNYKTKDIPILFLTAVFKKEEFIRQGFDLGAVDYFTKPIDKHLMLNRINLYLSLFIKNNEIQKLNYDLVKKTEKAEKLAKSKSEFLANMSHEIRTPLNAILGFIELIKDETKEDKILEYANIVNASSISLLKIIEDILDFSKIETGKLNIDKIDFDTRKEFELISHLFQARFSEKNVILLVKFDDNVPQFINTDPLRIKQVISNLLSNAIKFSKSNTSVIVHFSYKNNKLFVSVKDEGKGISKDKLESIFEAFSQEDNSITREYGGTGLGLTISSRLINILGGELKVKSELGVGSEFYFDIPITISQQKSQQKSQNSLNVNFEGKKVLLAEDNLSNQLFMKILFKKLKLQYDMANDGLEAVNSFKKNSYDAILMDENMPNMSGTTATMKIIEYEKENNLKHTPIIALTANALKGDKERFLEAGMDD